MKSFKRITAFCFLVTMTFGLCVATAAQKDKPVLTQDEAKTKQAYTIGVQAYM